MTEPRLPSGQGGDGRTSPTPLARSGSSPRPLAASVLEQDFRAAKGALSHRPLLPGGHDDKAPDGFGVLS